jgi:hypothetical protein
MNWLRNNDPNPADVDDPTARGWRTLATHARQESVPEEKAQWLRIQ